NTSRKSCRLELTTYLELALAPHRADHAHPAFSKLFIETEWLPHCKALLAHRRLRGPDEQPIWAAHLMVPESSSFPGTPEFETDRAQFLGRGRTLGNPIALSRSLTNRVGAVLDPIFSQRRQITILPNQRFQCALVTVVAESREAVIGLVERYADFHTCARAFETAWTHSQLEMRRLHIRPGDVQSFRQLAAHVLFPQAQLRPPPARLGRRSEGQRALWRQGISGDLPIVVVMIGHIRDIEVVREILTAHTFWHLRGLKADLVLVNEELPSYEEPLAPDQQTPLPWVNIMANSKFGALVSESGADFVWGSNSQNDRLTPWFNDPISDPPGTAIYIRDDDIGVVWSPTPQPIRERDAYRTRHGQGYTIFEHNSHAIEQILATFVP